jgi:uncharacterized membrane protein
MNLVFKILLVIHVIAGSIGLITGTINIIRKKADKIHKIVGKYFFLSMIINSVAGFLIAAIHRNIFLLIIAVFSFYMTATGQRILSLKRIDRGQKAKPIDWILTIVMALLTLFFVIFAIRLLIYNNNFGIVLLVFGAISGLMVKKDISIYQGNIKQKNYWLLIHIQRMIGAYIAALTAFLVVNNTYLPPVLAWLLPTLILTPLIFYWSKKYAVKKISRRR